MWDVFLLVMGIFLGVWIIYLLIPSLAIIIKYPTLENVGKITYIDKNGQCYKYYVKEIPCSGSLIYRNKI